MALHFLTFEGPDAFPQQIPLWNALLENAATTFEAPSFFLTKSWLEPWLEHSGHKDQFFWAVLADRESQRWVAALPMTVVSGSLLGTRVRHLVVAGYPESDCIFIPAESKEVREKFVAELLNYWETSLDSVVTFDLREIPEGGSTETALSEWAQRNNRSMIFQTVARSPRYSIEDFIVAGNKTTGKLGRNLRRRMRILNETGQAHFHFERVAAEGAEEKLNACALLEDQSWKGEKNVGVLNKTNCSFIHSVWKNLLAENSLGLATLKLDGKLVAYHWGMICDGVFLSYNLAQLSEVDSLSPGTLLLDHMIQNAEALGIREFDASRGGVNHSHSLAPYKGPVRLHRRVVMCRRTVLGRLMAWRLRRYITEQEATCTD